ncbi:hexitol phosphatase HxpB [Rudanella paleaurantiibacter]|uniref:Hexitol phosphatase HxpB n=1 Tax=Rudanella paleaurantiibacter TaxID=2614655 RepID=A0A7J5TTZ2_9BACT|nr:hexitol phosphatase HxpB [Rudanella paleaurantiibacter]KAB7725609.1 hexitol phosphatase HxpB [Rudanella paleaurantiibacter]
MIQAAIFDMDGLLVDSEPHWRAVEIDIFATVGLHLTEDECKRTTGLPTDAVAEYWFERRPWDETIRTRAEIGEAILEGAHRQIGLRAEPMPGAVEILRFFHDRGIPTAIASASPMNLIEVVIDRLGIRSLLKTWHSATLEARNKPAPDVYLGAARKLGVTPTHCLAFEDSGNGLKSAHGANMITVAVPALFEAEDPKFAIANLIIPSLLAFDEPAFQSLEAAIP